MATWIAERRLIAEVLETGQRVDVIVKIGIPYWLPDDEFASCPLALEGLFDRVADAKGIDLVHALSQAADVDNILGALRGKYNFYWPTGEAYFEVD